MKKVKEFVKAHVKAFIGGFIACVLTIVTLGLYAKFKK